MIAYQNGVKSNLGLPVNERDHNLSFLSGYGKPHIQTHTQHPHSYRLYPPLLSSFSLSLSIPHLTLSFAPSLTLPPSSPSLTPSSPSTGAQLQCRGAWERRKKTDGVVYFFSLSFVPFFSAKKRGPEECSSEGRRRTKDPPSCTTSTVQPPPSPSRELFENVHLMDVCAVCYCACGIVCVCVCDACIWILQLLIVH